MALPFPEVKEKDKQMEILFWNAILLVVSSEFLYRWHSHQARKCHRFRLLQVVACRFLSGAVACERTESRLGKPAAFHTGHVISTRQHDEKCAESARRRP
jgi:hypothetical protein